MAGELWMFAHNQRKKRDRAKNKLIRLQGALLLSQWLSGHKKLSERRVAEQAFRGGAQHRQFGNVTSTPNAGHTVKTEGFWDLASILRALDVDEDNASIEISECFFEIESYSTVPHIVTPFIIKMENGETIAATSGTNNDPLSAVDQAVNGNYSVKLGEPLVGRSFFDNGTRRYSAKTGFDVTQEARRFMREDWKLDQLEHATLPALMIGVHNYEQTPNTAVYVESFLCISYHTKEQKIVQI